MTETIFSDTTTTAADNEVERGNRLRDRYTDLHENDRAFRASEPDTDIADAAHELAPNLARVVSEVMTRYSNRPALGRRAREIVRAQDGTATARLLPQFDLVTYGTAWSRASALATSLAQDEIGVRPGDFIATLGFASVDYVIAELATVRLGAVAVPLQSGASAGQLSSIAREVEPVVLAADVENLSVAVDVAGQCRSIRRIVVLDFDSRVDADNDRLADARSRSAESGITVRPLAELVDEGIELPQTPLFDAEDPDRLASLIYTSGSTGAPKGAIHTDRIVSGSWTGAWHNTGASTDSADTPRLPVITLDYLPMSHLAGRGLVFSTLAAGGTVHFAGSSDLSTLFEDFSLARPTLLLLIPRVCEMIRHTALTAIDREIDSGAADHDEARRRILENFRVTEFGGRVLAAMVGTAPIAAEVKDFVTDLLDVHVQDNYGSTEAGMVLHDGVVQRPPVLAYKLDDVPELGYFSSDTPHPRGELLLKTGSIIPGYYKRPDVTAEMFDDDGFYRTGDVVAEIDTDHLVYVDRRKNVLKLAQGEFVALARLEALFGTSDLIDQIFVYGNGERSYLLAVVVPAKDHSADSGTIIESLQQIARNEELNSYEIPREIIIESEPFTQDNGLLSGAGKQLRPKLIERYGSVLEQRYTELEDGQTALLRELRRSGADAPVLDTVGKAARALLGCSGSDVRPDAHFSDLGGDSLSALTFSTLLRDIYEVDVPVGVITGPAMDLAALADYIDSARDSDSTTATFATVHGRDAREASAADLTLSAFLDPQVLDAAGHVPGPRTRTETVLLTGANGYLGRFLCLEWLEKMAETGGTVVCLIRGRSDADARTRLDAAFDTGDAELSTRYRALADTTLEVRAGDLGTYHFDLAEDTWNSLAERIDRIVHPAALVNHALPYEQLFGPNVVGTAEIVRLAISHHLKPVTYLSTVAVAAGVERFVEDGDIRDDSPTRSVDESYANGYGTSKWAGEVLLRNAFDAYALPVSVFRSDMILAHSKWSGQLNVPDVFTRLMLSIVATGIAPRTFYDTTTGAPTDDRGRPLSHYDGLPADFTAAAITSIGGDQESGFHTFDVLNPHDDNISLDTFVDWIRDAGRRIEIIDDYNVWFDRFSSALKSLPEKQRTHSLLPLIHAYEHPDRPSAGAHLPAEKFESAVDEIPHLGRDLIVKYLSDLEQLGLIARV